ncbi:MAG: transglutaminase domain-containing protein [Bacteroidales bacterium]|jgi:transglutaminase-like putative cysteine protease|nr:transglutaminase domain-containing protein [Bacteroidales bacterium]
MKNLFFLLFTAIMLTSFAADDKHFLTDATYRAKVHKQFESRKKEAAGRQEALFSVFQKEKLSTEQREALEFLYAYMPLSDLADYDGKFFLEQVKVVLKARDSFAWGKNIPEEVFRHFVLPYRVNNENLDTARMVCFNELKDRVKNLSLYDAILEVNHWSHEKASYRGTDMRTSGPLSLIRTSWGRCGEESTLTTTALRAVGIPARQCYTPRWAHTESNHAWVEVWVNGEWHFIGACEPEAVMDVAWFVGPATRAMMVHTVVFGLYEGAEEKNNITPWFTRINILKHYADTRRVNVQVLDDNNQPVQDAIVKFNVFNGGSLSPVSTNATDKQGKVSVVSGKGDLLIWANKGDRFGYKISMPLDENNVVRLNLRPGTPLKDEFILNPPPGRPVKDVVTDKGADNAARSAQDDLIRNAYMQTFITEDAARQFAKDNRLDEEKTWKVLNNAQGNWRDLRDFILKEKNNPDLFPFLEVLTEKDLRDTPLNYLLDHLQDRKTLKIKAGTPDEMVVPFILSPRIENELIRPWRSFLQKNISKSIQAEALTNIDKIVELIKSKVKISEEENYYECPISPVGVYQLGLADKRSRNILFVAIARSLGIPARSGFSNPQYYEKGEWKTVYFEAGESAVAVPAKGTLVIDNQSKDNARPVYNISLFSDGDFRWRGFGGARGNRDSNADPNRVPLDAGYYRILSGIRGNGGSAYISLQHFEIKGNETVTLPFKNPEIVTKIEVKGAFDMETKINTNDNKSVSLKTLSKGKGLALFILDPNKEPSKHILQDFPSVQTEIQDWGGGVVFLVPDDKVSEAFRVSAFPGLPAQAVWATDQKRVLLNAITKVLNFEIVDNFPLTLYISDKGEILYDAVGYKIGTGKDILNVIELEKKK